MRFAGVPASSVRERERSFGHNLKDLGGERERERKRE